MYPIGEEIAGKLKSTKPDRPFWEHGWNSSKEDAWPKLLHYRVKTISRGQQRLNDISDFFAGFDMIVVCGPCWEWVYDSIAIGRIFQLQALPCA